MEGALPQGPVVGADLFRTMSYGYDPATGLGFTLATFRITGAELLKGLELGLSLSGDLFLQVSGMHYEYDSRLPIYQMLLPGSVRIDGRPVDPGRLYSVTSNAGMVQFLPTYGITVQDVVVLPTPEYLVARDAIARKKLLVPLTTGRIREVAFSRR